MPDNMKCKNQEECFIVSERRTLTLEEENKWSTNGSNKVLNIFKADGWVTTATQFKRRPVSPVGNVNDMIEVLAAGEFDILKDFSQQFSLFYTTFIETYSDFCREQISDPVARDIQWITKRYDQSGNVVGESEAAPKQTVYIERKYDEAFQHYYGSWFAWGTWKSIQAIASGKNPGNYFLGNIRSVERFISSGCKTDRVNIVYQNMYNYAYGKPAIKGKFITKKEPIKYLNGHQISAPNQLAILNQKKIQEKTQKKIPSSQTISNPDSASSNSIINIGAKEISKPELTRAQELELEVKNFQKEIGRLSQELQKILSSERNEKRLYKLVKQNKKQQQQAYKKLSKAKRKLKDYKKNN